MREGNARELGRSQKRHLDSDLSCSLTMLFRVAATTGLPRFLCLQIMLSYRCSSAIYSQIYGLSRSSPFSGSPMRGFQWLCRFYMYSGCLTVLQYQNHEHFPHLFNEDAF